MAGGSNKKDYNGSRNNNYSCLQRFLNQPFNSKKRNNNKGGSNTSQEFLNSVLVQQYHSHSDLSGK